MCSRSSTGWIEPASSCHGEPLILVPQNHVGRGWENLIRNGAMGAAVRLPKIPVLTVGADTGLRHLTARRAGGLRIPDT